MFFLTAAAIVLTSLLFVSRHRAGKITHHLLKIQCRLMAIRLNVTFEDKLDVQQSYLMMGNHQSMFDLFVIPAAFPIPFVGIQAAEHFSYPVFGYIIRKWGNIPIERENLTRAKQSLETARNILKNGMNICVLPEGHRTLTGRLKPFKKGPFHLAKQTKVGILPFGVKGLYDYHPKGSFVIQPGEVKVRVGKVIPYDSFKDLPVEALRDKVFERIQYLSQ